MRYFITIVTFLSLTITGNATTWYVPDNYGTIQGAIDNAVNGDTIIVRPGIYIENINFLGMAITLNSEEGAEKTTIDGNNDGSVVVFENSEGTNSVLNGFTLTNGSGTLSGGITRGGGIYCLNSSSPTIINNTIIGNTAYYGGGIYPRFNSSPNILDNHITGNTAEYGGGILCHESSPKIKGNTISGNIAQNEGGGVVVQFSSAPTIQNNIITGNWALEYGGGIEILHASSPTIEDNIITYNVAQTNGGGGIGIAYDCMGIIKSNTIAFNSSQGTLWCGGGIIVSDNSSITITNNHIYENSSTKGGGIDVNQNSSVTMCNNTIQENIASVMGGGIACRQNSSVVVTNTILWHNNAPTGPEIYIGTSSFPSSTTINYSNMEEGQLAVYVSPGSTLDWGLGMIDGDPLFVDSPNNDYHLIYNSPCKDTGNNAEVAVPYDFESDPRIAYGTVDMGADEFHPHLYLTGDSTPTGNVEIKFIGLPGDLMNCLLIGVNIFDPPLPCDYGFWYMDNPFQIMTGFGVIPAEGVKIFPGTIPGTTPAPLTVYIQAAINSWLTNLYTVNVQ